MITTSIVLPLNFVSFTLTVYIITIKFDNINVDPTFGL